MEILKVIILGIIEGITEWLPISSTGHMILADEFIHLDVSRDFMNMFLVVIQFGAILAVISLYFRKLCPWTLDGKFKVQHEVVIMWIKIIAATLPAAVVGYFLDDFITERLYNPVVIGAMLIIYGIAFLVVENKRKKPTVMKLENLTMKTAVTIGLFQMLALVPGTSRSGAIIVGALAIGVSRVVATEFAFFLAIPVMFGASLLKVHKFQGTFTPNESNILIIGTAVSFAVSVLCIRFLMKYIKTNDFKPFGYYRVTLGILVIVYFALK
ncbi:undecaprenyl-diphosphatase 1 [Clostridia bacterium]|nr:undecaprenyl-diphosphatase 1 [Clostridia bacterium]